MKNRIIYMVMLSISFQSCGYLKEKQIAGGWKLIQVTGADKINFKSQINDSKTREQYGATLKIFKTAHQMDSAICQRILFLAYADDLNSKPGYNVFWDFENKDNRKPFAEIVTGHNQKLINQGTYIAWRIEGDKLILRQLLEANTEINIVLDIDELTDTKLVCSSNTFTGETLKLVFEKSSEPASFLIQANPQPVIHLPADEDSHQVIAELQKDLSHANGAFVLTSFNIGNVTPSNVAGIEIKETKFTAMVQTTRECWKVGNPFMGYFQNFIVLDREPVRNGFTDIDVYNARQLGIDAVFELSGSASIIKQKYGWKTDGINITGVRFINDGKKTENHGYSPQIPGLQNAFFDEGIREKLIKKFYQTGNNGGWMLYTNSDFKWDRDENNLGLYRDYVAFYKECCRNPLQDYVASGDFNGDGYLDYAIMVKNVNDQSNIASFIFYGPDLHFEKLENSCETVSTVYKKDFTTALNSKGDALSIECFQKSSWLVFWNGYQFERFFTSD